MTSPARRRREVYFTDEQAAWEGELGIRNLSEYVRHRMKEDLDRKTPLRSMSEEIARRRRELDELQDAFQARAVDQERALEIVEAAAAQVRHNLAKTATPAASVQTSILRWVQRNPNGRRVRDILPDSLSDRDVVDILERWPDSRADVVRILEVRP